MKAELWINERHDLAESPFYDPRTKKYSWVDIDAGRLWISSNSGERYHFELGQLIGAAVPGEKCGSYVLAAGDGLYLYSDGKAEQFCDLSGVYPPQMRSNDAKADPAGRLWFGSSGRVSNEMNGALYRYDNGAVTVMQAETRIANGMAWSSDKTRFFFSETLCRAVFVYDHDNESGEIHDRRVLFEVEKGLPDGMCIDADDNLWVAFWDGGRIEKRSTETGEKLDEIQLPAQNITSCCFGGDEFDTLLITSSGAGLDGKYDGCLFRCVTDVQGKAPDYAMTNI